MTILFSARICHLPLLSVVASHDSLYIRSPSRARLRNLYNISTDLLFTHSHCFQSRLELVYTGSFVAEKASHSMSLRPESMSSRGSTKYQSNYERGGTSRRSLTTTKGGRSASLGGNELPPGDLVVRFHAADISPSGGPAQISHFQCIASYNWLDSSEPIILVPGISFPFINPY